MTEHVKNNWKHKIRRRLLKSQETVWDAFSGCGLLQGLRKVMHRKCPRQLQAWILCEWCFWLERKV